jgi:hypothetical protein
MIVREFGFPIPRKYDGFEMTWRGRAGGTGSLSASASRNKRRQAARATRRYGILDPGGVVEPERATAFSHGRKPVELKPKR